MIIKSLFLILVLVILSNIKINSKEMKFSEVCHESNLIVSHFLQINNDENDDDQLLIETQAKVQASLEVLDQALDKFK